MPDAETENEEGVIQPLIGLEGSSDDFVAFNVWSGTEQEIGAIVDAWQRPGQRGTSWQVVREQAAEFIVVAHKFIKLSVDDEDQSAYQQKVIPVKKKLKSYEGQKVRIVNSFGLETKPYLCHFISYEDQAVRSESGSSLRLTARIRLELLPQDDEDDA